MFDLAPLLWGLSGLELCVLAWGLSVALIAYNFLVEELRGKSTLTEGVPWHMAIFLVYAAAVGFWLTHMLIDRPAFGLKAAVACLAAMTLAMSGVISVGLLKYAKALTARFSKTWVKALDFPYLMLAFVGVVRLLNSSPNVAEQVSNFDAAGVVFLALALSIRLSKAVMEVFFDRSISRTVDKKRA